MAPEVQTTRTVSFEAFAQVLETRLVSYLRYTTGSMDEAEDLYQEAMLRAHRDWKRVAVMEKPESWVFRVARNLALNQMKRRAIERKAVQERSQGSPESAESPAETNETRRAVQAALQTLPDDQREAVCLKVWGEFSWVQIARELGVSDDTACRLFARGLKAIAPQLKELSP